MFLRHSASTRLLIIVCHMLPPKVGSIKTLEFAPRFAGIFSCSVQCIPIQMQPSQNASSGKFKSIACEAQRKNRQSRSGWHDNAHDSDDCWRLRSRHMRNRRRHQTQRRACRRQRAWRRWRRRADGGRGQTAVGRRSEETWAQYGGQPQVAPHSAADC